MKETRGMWLGDVTLRASSRGQAAEMLGEVAENLANNGFATNRQAAKSWLGVGDMTDLNIELRSGVFVEWKAVEELEILGTMVDKNGVCVGRAPSTRCSMRSAPGKLAKTSCAVERSRFRNGHAAFTRQ